VLVINIVCSIARLLWGSYACAFIFIYLARAPSGVLVLFIFSGGRGCGCVFYYLSLSCSSCFYFVLFSLISSLDLEKGGGREHYNKYVGALFRLVKFVLQQLIKLKLKKIQYQLKVKS